MDSTYPDVRVGSAQYALHSFLQCPTKASEMCAFKIFLFHFHLCDFWSFALFGKSMYSLWFLNGWATGRRVEGLKSFKTTETG